MQTNEFSNATFSRMLDWVATPCACERTPDTGCVCRTRDASLARLAQESAVRERHWENAVWTLLAICGSAVLALSLMQALGAAQGDAFSPGQGRGELPQPSSVIMLAN